MHGRAGPCLPKWPGLAGREVDRLLSPSPLQLFSQLFHNYSAKWTSPKVDPRAYCILSSFGAWQVAMSTWHGQPQRTLIASI